MKRRGNLARLLALIILLLLIVGCLLIVIQVSFADQLANRYPGSLRSKLMADYSADPEGTVRRPLDPALIADRLADDAAQTPQGDNVLPQRMATATAMFGEPIPTVTPIPPRGGQVGMATPAGPAAGTTSPSSPEEGTPTTIPAGTTTGTPQATATGTLEATATGTLEATATGTLAATATGTLAATATGTLAATATGTLEATATSTLEATATSTLEATATSTPAATATATQPPVVTEEPSAPTATPTLTPTPTSTTLVSLAASSKRASQGWVFPDEHVTYTISISNDGLLNATNVTVSDTVPAEMTLDPGSIFGPASSLNGNTIQWGPFDVTAGQSIPMGFSAQPVYLPLPNVARRPVTNVAQIAANGVAPFDRQAIIEVPYPPELDFASPPNIIPPAVLVGERGVVFQSDVVNVGSADTTVDTTSQFKFVDAGGVSHVTTLAANTLLPTGGAPITLKFAPMDIPATSNTGSSTLVSLSLSGLDENGVYDTRILSTTAAADQITIKDPVLQGSLVTAPTPVPISSVARFEFCVNNVGTTDGDFYGPPAPDTIKAEFPPDSGWSQFLTATVTSEPIAKMWSPYRDPSGQPAIKFMLTDTLPFYTWPVASTPSCWETYLIAPSVPGTYTLSIISTIEQQAGVFSDTFPVVVQAPPPPLLHDLASSMGPSPVEQGQTVSFSIWVYNDGGSDVTLSTSSTFTFTDGTEVYLSNLITPTLIPNWGLGSPVALTFAPFNVGTVAPGLWPTNLSLHGTDAYSQPYDDAFTTDSSNWVTVNAAPLLMAFPTTTPSPPFATGSPVSFNWVNVQNIGDGDGLSANSADNIVMSFEPGSGWGPFTNVQVFSPPGWGVITDTVSPVITFTVAAADSPYTWLSGLQKPFGFDTVAPATAGVYTFTVYSSLDNGTRHFTDSIPYVVQ